MQKKSEVYEEETEVICKNNSLFFCMCVLNSVFFLSLIVLDSMILNRNSHVG